MARVLLIVERSVRRRAELRVVDGSAGADTKLPIESIDADRYAVDAIHHWLTSSAASRSARVLRPSDRILLVDEDFDNHRTPNTNDSDPITTTPTMASRRSTPSGRRPAANRRLSDVETLVRTIAGRP